MEDKKYQIANQSSLFLLSLFFLSLSFFSCFSLCLPLPHSLPIGWYIFCCGYLQKKIMIMICLAILGIILASTIGGYFGL